MTREIRSVMTEARARRLEAVIADPRAPRGRGPTGCDCMRLGWTEYKTGVDESGLATCDWAAERVTAAGWAALDEFRGRA